MVDTPIYDWIPTVVPTRQLFHEGGQSFDGGFTAGGVRALSPEPGGVAWLEMEFGYQRHGADDPRISWLISKIANGNIFRVPLWKSPQLISLAALGVTSLEQYEALGIPWDNGQPWDNGFGWALDVVATASAIALEGTLEIAFNMGSLANGVQIGHAIGHKSVVYLVDEIEYSGATASVALMRPLRKDMAVGDLITFRPAGTFMAQNPESFRGVYQAGDLLQLGSVTMMEARV